MRPNISLAIHEIELRETSNSGSKKGNVLKFTEFPHKEGKIHLDLLDILKKIFSDIQEKGDSLKNESLDVDDGKRIFLDICPTIFPKHPSYNKDRSLYGRVRYGTGGKESQIRKTINNNLVSYVDEDETAYDPYYFLIILPKDSKTGCLILEQKNGDGIKGIFVNAFMNTLKDYSDYAHCEINVRRAYPEEMKER
ncbi:MAG: hypothetical protein KO253_02845, partial [Methanobrevibacter arboriphilus]|nr:hypothetical protein [Methanobrevibacter arboriphilus]